MIAVNEINVSVTGRPEEYGGAGCIADGSVRSGIVFSEIGLDLDDAGGKAYVFGVTDEDFAEEFASDTARTASEEGAIKRKDGREAGHGLEGRSQESK